MKKQAAERVVVVLVTCPNRIVANRLAKELVGRRLAACVNLLPNIKSVFTWKGRVELCREVLLIIKTTARRFEPLRRAVTKLHPYDVPEVIALPVSKGHQPYLRWLTSTSPGSKL